LERDPSHAGLCHRTLHADGLHEASHAVAAFSAELAAQHSARLILQHVIRPQERREALSGRSIDQVEADLLSLVPAELQGKISAQCMVAPGDPTDCPVITLSPVVLAEFGVGNEKHQSAEVFMAGVL